MGWTDVSSEQRVTGSSRRFRCRQTRSAAPIGSVRTSERSRREHEIGGTRAESRSAEVIQDIHKALFAVNPMRHMPEPSITTTRPAPSMQMAIGPWSDALRSLKPVSEPVEKSYWLRAVCTGAPGVGGGLVIKVGSA